MFMIFSGGVMLAATAALFMWGVPRNGQPSRVPDKWGLGTAFPIVLMTLGVIGLVLLLKGVLS